MCMCVCVYVYERVRALACLRAFFCFIYIYIYYQLATRISRERGLAGAAQTEEDAHVTFGALQWRVYV